MRSKSSAGSHAAQIAWLSMHRVLFVNADSVKNDVGLAKLWISGATLFSPTASKFGGRLVDIHHLICGGRQATTLRRGLIDAAAII